MPRLVRTWPNGGLGRPGLQVFSASLAKDRAVLGDRITKWLAASPEKHVVDRDVIQTSAAEYHCLSIVLFYYEVEQ